MNRDNTDDAPAAGRMVQYLRWHGLGYCAVLVVLAIVHFLAPGNWGVFWPMLIWSVLLTVHCMVVKSLATGQDWASERSSNIVHNATDLSHIKSIRERHERRVSQSRPEAEAENSAADKEIR